MSEIPYPKVQIQHAEAKPQVGINRPIYEYGTSLRSYQEEAIQRILDGKIDSVSLSDFLGHGLYIKKPKPGLDYRPSCKRIQPRHHSKVLRARIEHQEPFRRPPDIWLPSGVHKVSSMGVSPRISIKGSP